MNKIAFVLMLLVAVLGFLLLTASNKAAAEDNHGRQALSAVVSASPLLTLRHPPCAGQVHVLKFVKTSVVWFYPEGRCMPLGKI